MPKAKKKAYKMNYSNMRSNYKREIQPMEMG